MVTARENRPIVFLKAVASTGLSDMKIDEDLVKAIAREVYGRFWDSAPIRRCKIDKQQLASGISMDFVSNFEDCIRVVVGEFADLLAQAVIARSRRMTPRRRGEIM